MLREVNPISLKIDALRSGSLLTPMETIGLLRIPTVIKFYRNLERATMKTEEALKDSGYKPQLPYAEYLMSGNFLLLRNERGVAYAFDEEDIEKAYSKFEGGDYSGMEFHGDDGLQEAFSEWFIRSEHRLLYDISFAVIREELAREKEDNNSEVSAREEQNIAISKLIDPKKAVERRISQLSHKYGLDEEDKKAREILKLLNKALTLDKPLFDF